MDKTITKNLHGESFLNDTPKTEKGNRQILINSMAKPVKVLQDLLGHTDISITFDTYSDVFENFQTENIQKIDNYMSTAGFAMNA